MYAGRHFPSLFEGDNFQARRGSLSTSGVAYDPESLLTGGEKAAGLTYNNSARNWPDEMTYHEAVAGSLTTEEILLLAPRVLLEQPGYRIPNHAALPAGRFSFAR